MKTLALLLLCVASVACSNISSMEYDVTGGGNVDTGDASVRIGAKFTFGASPAKDFKQHKKTKLPKKYRA